ncbi:MAG: TetR/AcrR family transcriptional regulator [Treponema sp.]|uniref:TetR/AcrR family transcriptional regulator n=1 Tax=Treponema sp. TaxID=166 RepID=UPI0025E9406B|nr:TetR/AcrR family transcriptional regulator [Treponema sp.]MBR0496774.1 TetR/AcrR family transcriptional regulator [Treponema sp.]
MSKKNISQEKIIQSFIASAFEKSPGATSLSDISEILGIKKASLYNHFESRDAMYEATLEFCASEIAKVGFATEGTLDTIIKNKTSPLTLIKKLIARFFNLFENEPLFEMYSFVRTEQYFNIKALEIVRKENQRIYDDIYKIIEAFCAVGKIKQKNEREIADVANILSSYLIQSRDFYIANRKETVRQNPESGAGSLFALPTDDQALNKIQKSCEIILKNFLDL